MAAALRRGASALALAVFTVLLLGATQNNVADAQLSMYALNETTASKFVLDDVMFGQDEGEDEWRLPMAQLSINAGCSSEEKNCSEEKDDSSDKKDDDSSSKDDDSSSKDDSEEDDDSKKSDSDDDDSKKSDDDSSSGSRTPKSSGRCRDLGSKPRVSYRVGREVTSDMKDHAEDFYKQSRRYCEDVSMAT